MIQSVSTNCYLLIVIFSLFTFIITQAEGPISLQIDKPLTNTLTKETGLSAKYIFDIDIKKDIPPNQLRWYAFFNVQPTQNKGWEAFDVYLSVKSTWSQVKISKNCSSSQGVDSCFVTSRRFNPMRGDILQAQIRCKQECSYKVNAQITTQFKMEINTSMELDFQNSAYSQVFTLDLGDADYDEVRIILKPLSFLNYAVPFELYANSGWRTPTRQNAQFKGIHLWDDGQGLFLHKQDIGMFTKLTILVSGPQKNLLVLQNTLLKQGRTTQLIGFEPYFDYVRGADETRKYNFTIIEKSYNNYIRIVTFSGFIYVDKIINKQNSKEIGLKPVQEQKGQLEYRISPKKIAGDSLKNIEFTIKGKKASTYLVEFYHQKAGITYLKQQLSKLAQLSGNQIDQYYVNMLEVVQKNKVKTKFSINIQQIQGNYIARFFQCKKLDNPEGCQLTEEELKNPAKVADKVMEINPTVVNSKLQERHYFFQVSINQFTLVGSDMQRFIFMAVITSNNSIATDNVEYTIEFNNNGRIVLLKQQQLKADRCQIGQKKYYKFSNFQNDVTQIKVHTLEISGKAKFYGTLIDPRQSNESKVGIVLPQLNTITFINTNKNSTVYIVAEGVQYSYYTLILQLMRKSENDTTKNSSQGFNQLLLVQKIEYEFILKPKGKIVFQGHPKKNFYIYFKSSIPLEICMTQKIQSPPFAPNCQIQQNLIQQRTDKLQLQYGDVVNIGVSNNNDKNASFTIKMVSLGAKNQTQENQTSPSNLSNCENGILGRIMETDSTSPYNKYCITYTILEFNDMELSIEFGNWFTKNASISVKIGDNQKLQIISEMKKFKKNQLQKDCNYSTSKICKVIIQLTNIQPTRMFILLQYLNKEVRLMDGLAFSFHGVMSITETKRFSYLMPLLKNTTIFLENRVGYYKFYAKIMKLQQYQHSGQGNISKLYPTSSQHEYSSSNPFYFLYQTYTINQKQLLEKYKQDQQHILLITVVLDDESRQIQENGKFVIQVTQDVRFLKQHNPALGYLQKKSLAFFQYYNEQSNRTILISITNQNKNCLTVYVRKGVDKKATSSEYDQIGNGNQIIINKAEKGIYSITLQSKDHCPYQIQVSSSLNQIVKITKGSFTDINLQQNQTTYLIYSNDINQGFRVISALKSGELMIKVKSVDYQSFDKTINQTLETLKYDFSGVDVVRVDKDKPKFCYQCYYIISIKATKKAQASILIPSPKGQLPISTDKLIKDSLQVFPKQKYSENMTYRIYTGKVAQFQVYVQQGKLNITIVSEDKQIEQKIFSQSKQPQYYKFQIKKNPDQSFQLMKFSKVIITAMQNSYFSFALISAQDKDQRGQNVKYGIPQYLFLEKDKPQCLKGKIQTSSEQFLLSYTLDNSEISQDLSIDFKVGDKKVELRNKTAKKQMILQLPENYAVVNSLYEICLKSKMSLVITFIHIGKINFFPSNATLYVKKQLNLTFGSQGKNILEINQCGTRATTVISSDFNSIKSLTHQIDQNRKSNNLIEFYYYGPVFINVQAFSASISRKEQDKTKGLGYGYQDYSANTIRIIRNQQYLDVVIKPIQVKNKFKTSTIKKIIYTAYAAKEEYFLDNAINCQDGDYQSQTVTLNSSFSEPALIKFNVENKLMKKFSQAKYFLIGVLAELTVETLSKDLQVYRFNYQYQEVPKEMLTGQVIIIEDDFPPPPSSGFMTIIFYLIIVIILFFVFMFLYRKYLRRCLAKRQNLVELASGNQVQYSEFSH